MVERNNKCFSLFQMKMLAYWRLGSCNMENLPDKVLEKSSKSFCCYPPFYSPVMHTCIFNAMCSQYTFYVGKGLHHRWSAISRNSCQEPYQEIWSIKGSGDQTRRIISNPECNFHQTTNCSNDEEMSCEGKAHATKVILKCEFHHLAYCTVCELRASDAQSVVHPELGRRQPNLCEAHFSVLPHYKAKDQSLCRYFRLWSHS